jgi:hypothetical protein
MDRKLQDAATEWYMVNVKCCQVCSESDPMPAKIMAMLDLMPDGVTLKMGLQVIPIICECCGYTMLVSAEAIRPKPPAKPRRKNAKRKRRRPRSVD